MTVCCVGWIGTAVYIRLYVLTMVLDTPETCSLMKYTKNNFSIKLAFLTRLYRDTAWSTKHRISLVTSCRYSALHVAGRLSGFQSYNTSRREVRIESCRINNEATAPDQC